MMDIFLKLSQLVHAGEFEKVQTTLNNINHPDKHRLYIQCLHSSVAAQRYDMAAHFIKSVPSHADTAHFFKVAVRENDHKMVDILLTNHPNSTVCSEAVLEAVEYNNATTIEKMLLLSNFVSNPTECMASAIRHGSFQSLLCLLQMRPPTDETMEMLLIQSLYSGHQDKNGLQAIDVVMPYSSIDVMQKVIKNCGNLFQNALFQRLVETCAVRVQHNAITAAVGHLDEKHRPAAVRKM